MAYLSSRTNMPAWNKTCCVTKNDLIKGVVVTGLEPSPCMRVHNQVQFLLVHSIPSYFSKRIITTIRLSGSS